MQYLWRKYSRWRMWVTGNWYLAALRITTLSIQGSSRCCMMINLINLNLFYLQLTGVQANTRTFPRMEKRANPAGQSEMEGKEEDREESDNFSF